MLIQVVRWLKNTPIILVGHDGFACGALAWRCLKLEIILITKLKINACLYDFPPINQPSKRGRKKKKGERLYSFKKMLEMLDLGWKEVSIEVRRIRPEKKAVKIHLESELMGANIFSTRAD